MHIKNLAVASCLILAPGLSVAAVFSQVYALTSNSYYEYSYTDWNSFETVTQRSALSGYLNVNVEDNFAATIDYTNVLLNGTSFRSTDTLLTDLNGFMSMTLTSGYTGEFDYLTYGNATLSPYPVLCVECGYEMTLNLLASPTGNPLALSYQEFNSYGTGAASFKLYVSAVPVPAAAWLFGSGLVGLIGLAGCKRLESANKTV